MALYVQVIDGQMTQCIDTLPPVPIGQDGWKNAIEIYPVLIPYRQGVTGPTYYCDLNPVEIVWTAFDFTIEDRREGQLVEAANQFNKVVRDQAELETNSNPNDHYDAAIVAAAQSRYESLVVQINAATTQEELDVTQQELNNNQITLG